jgi:hypothetical protein
MRFILKGFTQEMRFRVFEFEKVGEDQTRTEHTVSADLALTQRYNIRVQAEILGSRTGCKASPEGRGLSPVLQPIIR